MWENKKLHFKKFPLEITVEQKCLMSYGHDYKFKTKMHCFIILKTAIEN